MVRIAHRPRGADRGRRHLAVDAVEREHQPARAVPAAAEIGAHLLDQPPDRAMDIVEMPDRLGKDHPRLHRRRRLPRRDRLAAAVHGLVEAGHQHAAEARRQVRPRRGFEITDGRQAEPLERRRGLGRQAQGGDGEA